MDLVCILESKTDALFNLIISQGSECSILMCTHVILYIVGSIVVDILLLLLLKIVQIFLYAYFVLLSINSLKQDQG